MTELPPPPSSRPKCVHFTLRLPAGKTHLGLLSESAESFNLHPKKGAPKGALLLEQFLQWAGVQRLPRPPQELQAAETTRWIPGLCSWTKMPRGRGQARQNSACMVIKGSLVAAARVGMPPASNERCQAFLPLQWFQSVYGCVCKRGPGARGIGTTTRVGDALGQNGVLKGPGEGSTVAWGRDWLCLCVEGGGQQVLDLQ